MSDLNYWTEFYQKFKVMKPSPFAVWVAGQLPPHDILCDVGCGNGRDSEYFKSLGHKVTSIDPASTYPSALKEDCADHWYGHETVYCRWLIHSLNEVQEESFLDRISNFENNIFIECRSDKDTKDPVLNGHYRRLISKTTLEDKLKKRGFWINYSREQRGWSPQENDDPLLIRIFATH